MMPTNRIATYASFLAYGAALAWVVMALLVHR